MSYTNIIKDMANLVGISYKNTRPNTLMVAGYSHTYRPEKSTPLWAWYENETTILIGIHGADDIRLNEIAIRQFLDPEKTEKEISNFCDTYRELIDSPKGVFIGAHSLGTWIVSSCEILNPNRKIEGVFFGSYVPNKDSPKSKFMATTSRFKKVFYNNDFFASNLLKINPLYNAIELQPRTNPFTFLNGHSLKNFTRDISGLNADIKKVYKTIPASEEKKLKTTLNIISYNIQMLNRYLFALESNDRARWIPEALSKNHPENEIFMVNELFDDEAENIFDKEMKKIGYFHSIKAGSKYDSRNIPNVSPKDLGRMILEQKIPKGVKIEDSGVKIYSKHPIETQRAIVYKQGAREDGYAAKGAVLIRIRKNEIPIHIIATHLQSGGGDEINKIKELQINQIRNELIDEGQEITIMGGDMNIDLLSQSYINMLNPILDNNNLELLPQLSKLSTTGADFSDRPGQQQILDHLYYKKSRRFNISGQVESIRDIRKDNGFWVRKIKRKKLNESIPLLSDLMDSIKNVEKDIENFFKYLFLSKKEKMRRLKKERIKELEKHYKKVYDLSDHYPIKVRLEIEEK